jgi:hypothetical protein
MRTSAGLAPLLAEAQTRALRSTTALLGCLLLVQEEPLPGQQRALALRHSERAVQWRERPRSVRPGPLARLASERGEVQLE